MELTDTIIQDSMINGKWADDQLRRDRLLRYLDYYYNRHNDPFLAPDGTVKSYITRELRKRIEDETEYEVFKQYIETDNIMERVVDNSSLMFRVEPTFPLEGASDKQIEAYDTLRDDLLFVPMLRTVNKLVNAVNDIAVIPAIRDGEIKLDIVTPDTAFVIQDPDDPTKALVFGYRVGALENSPTAESIHKYEYYTKDAKFSCKIMGGVFSEVTELYKHSYGKVPVVMFRNYLPVNTFWNPRYSFLADKNLQMDLQLTTANAIQNFKIPQKVRIGVDDEFQGKVGLTSTEDIKRNDSGDAIGSVDYIEPATDLLELRDMTLWRQSVLLATYGLNDNMMDSSTFTSGFQLYLAMSKVIEKNTEERPYYRHAIRELIELIFITMKEENIKPVLDFDKSKISVDFGELKMLQSPQEEAETNLININAGVWSAVQTLMKRNPDLTEEEAVNKINQIKEWNKLTAREFEFVEETDAD